jgi:hypothetical protein
MKKIIIILLLSFSSLHSQELRHQALSAQGTSHKLSNCMYVSQTIGQQSIMQMATWGGSGMYYVQIINPQGQIVDIKKIILQ